MPDAALAPGAQAAGLVEPGLEPALDRFADRHILVLDRVAERTILVDPGHRARILQVIIVELDPATTRSQRQHAIGLHAPGHHVQHHVGVDEEVERLAVTIYGVGVAQRRMLQRIPVEGFRLVGTVVQQSRQPRMHQRQVIALEEIVHVRLPVAGHVEYVAPREPHCREVHGPDALRDAGVNGIEVRHPVVQRDEHQALPLADAQRRQSYVVDREVLRVLHLGCADQPALVVVEPAMVFAAQVVHALAAAVRERASPVPANVGKCPQHAVAAAQDDHRCPRQVLDHVIACIRQLLAVRHELPGT